MTVKNEALSIDQHPGVQGLAQLGRNAIDRVLALEQARARDNLAFKQLLAQRNALLEALRHIADHDLRGADLVVCGHIAHGLIGRARDAIKAIETHDS